MQGTLNSTPVTSFRIECFASPGLRCDGRTRKGGRSLARRSSRPTSPANATIPLFAVPDTRSTDHCDRSDRGTSGNYVCVAGGGLRTWIRDAMAFGRIQRRSGGIVPRNGHTRRDRPSVRRVAVTIESASVTMAAWQPGAPSRLPAAPDTRRRRYARRRLDDARRVHRGRRQSDPRRQIDVDRLHYSDTVS